MDITFGRKEMIMKISINRLIVTAFVLCIVGFYCSIPATAAGNPTLEVVTPSVDLAKDTKIILKGMGFAPGQEVVVLFVDTKGVLTDIEHALKPLPKADANGNWETTWDAKRFMDRKLILAGEHKVSVADADYNVLDTKTIKFTGKFPKKKKK